MKLPQQSPREIRKGLFGVILRQGFEMPIIDKKMTLPSAVSILSAAISRHIFSSKHILEYVEQVEKGANGICPDSAIDEIIKYLAEQNGQIDKSDAALNLRFLDSFLFPIFDFQRDCFSKLFILNKDVSDFESNLFAYSIELGALIDELYYEWFEKIVIDYQNLSTVEKEKYEKTLKNELGYFDYTVFDYDVSENKIFNRKPWALAFRLTIKQIVDKLEELTDSCIEHGEKELHDYFKALSGAYACAEIEKLEEVWAEVDRMWIKIPTTCRMFPIHGMENQYEHPFGVSPEYKLVIRTDYGEKMISEIRHQTPVYASIIGVNLTLVSLAKLKLNNLDMGVFSMVVNSGVCANFRSVGQVVPNRQDILSEGGKVFMNLEGSQVGMNRAQDLLKSYCTPEVGEKLSKLLTVDHYLLHTIGHECNHPVGCSSESDNALGEFKNRLEEAKATIGGLIVILQGRPVREYPEIIAMCIARVCRFFKKETFENPTLQPYVRENLVIAALLISSGIISIKSSEEVFLSINLKTENLIEFEQSLKHFYLNVINAYQEFDPVPRIKHLEKVYCHESQTKCNWMNLVNRK